ncbi:MAG TPA: glycosyltransferase family 4 protein [Woeseiaceae bacterium]|nr:glycosyltransferase family 4 protein [Woeseiaceae bacterium]
MIESVPPRWYGGTERVVHYLTEALVRQGYDVTLYASADSKVAAKLVGCAERGLRLDPRVRDPLVHHVLMLERIRREAGGFDIIHFHIDYLHYPLVRALGINALTTLHGRLDLPDLPFLYREFDDIPLVSISNDQRGPLPSANWVGTVYHGLPRDLYRFHPKPEGYLAFLGRVSPEKRPDRAIEIACRAGLPLRIAAKVDDVDRDYFEGQIRPLLARPSIEFVGEVDERRKSPFLGRALALLFPVDWPEPFGLVMIEALACGTPVIAWRRGSVPEVIEDGVTGFIVDSIDGAVEAVRCAAALDRARIRRRFEERFTADRMARDYLRIYRSLLEDARSRSTAA